MGLRASHKPGWRSRLTKPTKMTPSSVSLQISESSQKSALRRTRWRYAPIPGYTLFDELPWQLFVAFAPAALPHSVPLNMSEVTETPQNHRSLPCTLLSGVKLLMVVERLLITLAGAATGCRGARQRAADRCHRGPGPGPPVAAETHVVSRSGRHHQNGRDEGRLAGCIGRSIFPQ